MNLFADPLLKLNEYNTLLEAVSNNLGPVSVIGPSDSQKVHIVYSMLTHIPAK